MASETVGLDCRFPLILVYLNSNLNNHTCLVAILLDSTAALIIFFFLGIQ